MSYASTILTDAPVGYWRMGEKSKTITFDCGFEDAALTTHWDNIGGAVLDSTITGRNGTNAARIDVTNTTTAFGISGKVGWTFTPITVVRFRFRLSAIPTANTRLFKLNGQTYYDSYLFYEASSGWLRYSNGAATAAGPHIDVDTWYTVDLLADGTNKAGRWMVDDIEYAQPGAAANSDNTNNAYFGKYESVAKGAFSMYVDDIAVSHTASDFPLGAGTVYTDDVWYQSIVDETGHGHNSTLANGTPSYGQAGAIKDDTDTSITMFGGNTTFNVPAHSDFDVGDVFTAEAWVGPVDYSYGGQSYYWWLGKYNASAGLLIGVAGTAAGEGAGALIAYDGANGTFAATASGIVPINTWTHVAITKSGSTRQWYVNGSPVTTTGTNYTQTNNSNLLGIGGPGGGNVASSFHGGLDEVAFYPTALSAASIAAHYNAGIGGAIAGARLVNLVIRMFGS